MHTSASESAPPRRNNMLHIGCESFGETMQAHVPEPPDQNPNVPPEIPPPDDSPDEDIDLPPREQPPPVREPEVPPQPD